MTYPTLTKNAWLNGQDIDAISLHTAFPGTTGLNEVTGGPYTRQANTLVAGSGGSRVTAGASTFSVPACTIPWVGTWKVGVFVAPFANGGAIPKNFSMSSGLLVSTAHGWSNTQKVAFFGVPPTGATEGTIYFVRDATTDTFNIAATSGGVALVLSGAASAGCWLTSIVESVYASPGTHIIDQGTLAVPD